MSNKIIGSSTNYPNRDTEVIISTIDNANFNKIVEAKKRVLGRGRYTPSENYKNFIKEYKKERIFPKEPCKGFNKQHIDRFAQSLFNVQTY